MRRRSWAIVLLLLAMTVSGVGAGALYKWVDQDGVVHYSDQAPEEADARDVETRPAVTGRPSAASEEAASTPTPTEDASNSREDLDVEIYTTSWCRYCQQAKDYFLARDIPFKEFDVEKDRAAARRLKRYNPRGGVPVTVIKGRPIIGFAPAAFDRAITQ
jgi:glutaredoxin-like YruB-family protein